MLVLPLACSMMTVGECRGWNPRTAAEGERFVWITGRISQAEGPRIGGRPGEFVPSGATPTG